MLNMFEVIETNNMIEHEKLDVRTITMGISLLDCCDDDLQALNEKIYKKIKESGIHRRRDRKRLWCADRKQAYFGYSDRAGRRLCLQSAGGFCDDCKNSG